MSRLRPLFALLALALAACGEEAAQPAPVAKADSDAQRIDGHAPEDFLLNEDCFAVARDPAFVDARDADFLASDDVVLGFESPGRVIAIPLRLISYHRLVELPWGQRRALISYTPLHGRTATYEVPADDARHGFGVAGHLLRELLFYDVRKRSLWLQKTGACISGWRKGEQLEPGPSPTRTTWSVWRAKYPMVQVMAPVKGMEDRYPSQWLKNYATPPGLAALPAKDPAAPTATWLNEDAPPTIDDPEWVAADATTYLKPYDDVLAFHTRVGPMAVPVFILAHNHAINAQLGGEDLLITVCDLCSTGAVYFANVDGTRLTFDLAGAYYGSALLEDRQTRSRWSVVTGACVFGWYQGVVLRALPSRWTHWHTWLAEYPRSQVLATRPVPEDVLALREGGLRGAPGLPAGLANSASHRDSRLERHALVFGLSPFPGDKRPPRAYPYDALRAAEGVANDTWGAAPIVVLFDVGSQTAAAYRRDLQGPGDGVISLRRNESSQFVDETGSIWTLGGHCVSGPRKGVRLIPIDGRSLQVEWYAWAASYPNTGIWTKP